MKRTRNKSGQKFWNVFVLGFGFTNIILSALSTDVYALLGWSSAFFCFMAFTGMIR